MPSVSELGQLIKSKYPGQYDDLPDVEVGRRTQAKFPGSYDDFTDTPSLPSARSSSDGFIQSIVKGIAKPFLQTGLGVARAAQGIGAFAGSPEEQQQYLQNAGAPANFGYFGQVSPAGLDPQGNPLPLRQGLTQAAGNAAQVASTVAAPVPGAGNFLARAAQTAAVTGLGSAGAELSDTGDFTEAAKSGTLGASLGLAGSALASGAKTALKGGLPRLLSYTSGVPKSVLLRQAEAPSAATQAVKQVKGDSGTKTLRTVQSSVRELRKELSAEFDAGKTAVIDQFAGKRFALDARETNALKKVVSSYPSSIDAPQSIKNISINEGLELYKQLNTVKAIGGTPEEVATRDLRKALRNKLVDLAGGERGPLDTLLKNYSAEKGLHDAVDMLVKAYDTGNPKAQATAQGVLKSVYRENKDAYYEVLQQFEKRMGVRILDKIAALNTQEVLPKSAKPSGDLQFWRTVLLPISSPRLAGLYSRTAGRAAELGKTIPGKALKTAAKVITPQLTR
jgi:hypothetical protein